MVRFPGIKAVLIGEHRPDEYQQRAELCKRHDVLLCWPDSNGSLEIFREALRG
jgi:hypothetical protein